MILDSGMATVFQQVNIAPPGDKPIFAGRAVHTSCYGELSFETSPARPTERREEVQTDARVRVLQCRRINNLDKVTLHDFTTGAEQEFEVTRAWHGTDPDSGELITDLSLRRINPEG